MDALHGDVVRSDAEHRGRRTGGAQRKLDDHAKKGDDVADSVHKNALAKKIQLGFSARCSSDVSTAPGVLASGAKGARKRMGVVIRGFRKDLSSGAGSPLEERSRKGRAVGVAKPRVGECAVRSSGMRSMPLGARLLVRKWESPFARLLC